jgi:hypothetical protein
MVPHIMAENGKLSGSLLYQEGIALEEVDGLSLGIIHTSQMDFTGQVFIFQSDPFIENEKAGRRDDPHEDTVRVPEKLVHIEILGNLDKSNSQRKEGHVVSVGLISHEKGRGPHAAEHVYTCRQEQDITERVNDGNSKELVRRNIYMEYVINQYTCHSVNGSDPEAVHTKDIELLGQTGMEPEESSCHVYQKSYGKSNLQIGHPGGRIFKKMEVYGKHNGRYGEVGKEHPLFLLPAEHVLKGNIP